MKLGYDYCHAEETEVLAERTDEHIRQEGLLPDHRPMHRMAHKYKSTFKHIYLSVWSSNDGDQLAPFTSLILMGFGDQLAVHQSHESSQYSRNTLRMDCTQSPNPLLRVVGESLWPHWTHLLNANVSPIHKQKLHGGSVSEAALSPLLLSIFYLSKTVSSPDLQSKQDELQQCNYIGN